MTFSLYFFLGLCLPRILKKLLRTSSYTANSPLKLRKQVCVWDCQAMSDPPFQSQNNLDISFWKCFAILSPSPPPPPLVYDNAIAIWALSEEHIRNLWSK